MKFCEITSFLVWNHMDILVLYLNVEERNLHHHVEYNFRDKSQYVSLIAGPACVTCILTKQYTQEITRLVNWTQKVRQHKHSISTSLNVNALLKSLAHLPFSKEILSIHTHIYTHITTYWPFKHCSFRHWNNVITKI